MGCDCCKVTTPNLYSKCKIAKGIKHGNYIAPCGMDFAKTDNSNITPKKKKRKRKQLNK